MSALRLKLAIAFALSGCAGLIYETAWARLLKLAFGSTSEAVAVVLGAFMAGLGIGAAAGGRLADRLDPRRALRLFAALELATAALAVASALLLTRFPATYAAIEQALGTGRLARTLCAGILLLPPTVLMGATLPLLARPGLALGGRAASVVGWLYAVNTAGAVLGAIASGFVLLPAAGVSASIWTGVLLDGLAALIALRLASAIAATPPAAAPEEAGATLLAAHPRRRLLLLSAFAAGATALGLEVLWSRTLLLTVGSSTQAFALMLATFLAGIALGSAIYARASSRLGADTRIAAALQIGIAISSVLLLRLAAVLPFVYLRIWERVADLPLGIVLLRLLPGVALMLGPTLLMGACLPALVRSANRSTGSMAADLGAIYGANTAGAIAGSLVVGLVALPQLGLARATAATAALGLLGAGLALAAQRRSPARATGPLWAALAAASLALAWLPELDPRVMGRGISYLAERASEFRRAGQLAEAIKGVRNVYYRDGAESSVLVYDAGEGTLRSFVVNGRHEATSSPNDMRNQYLLGHLPALLHRGPVARGLVIALGSGMTAGALARHAEAVTVVELEPAVVGAARSFAEWNHAALGDPRVRVVIDDGRHFLLASHESWDVITVDPIHPSVAGSESLYSLEQYQLVKRRLAPGGVAAQWLPLYQMGIEDARTITRTFAEAFPDAQLWLNGSDAILIGGAGARLPPATAIRDRLAQERISGSLRAVRLAGLGTLLAGFALGPDEVAAYAAGAPISRDDRPIVEFSLPWRTYEETTDRNLLEILRFAPAALPISLEGLDPAERDQIERSRAALESDMIAIALRLARHDDKMRIFFQQSLDLDPDDPFARQALER